MDEEIRLIRREKNSLLELQQVQEPLKRHPSIVERIRTASYKLKKNNLFKLNRTDFSILGRRKSQESKDEKRGEEKRPTIQTRAT